MKKKIFVVIGILVFVIIFAGYYMFTMSTENEKLSISSLDTKVMDENFSDYLSIYIGDSGIRDSQVWVNGTVNYTGPPEGHFEGFGGNIGMSISESGDKDLNIDIYYWSGQLVHSGSNPPIDTDKEEVPNLGGSKTSYPSSFDFSLTCNYKQ